MSKTWFCLCHAHVCLELPLRFFGTEVKPTFLQIFLLGANSESEIMNRTTMDMFLLHKSRDNPPQGCDFTYSLLFHLPADRQLSAPEPTEVNTNQEILLKLSQQKYSKEFFE